MKRSTLLIESLRKEGSYSTPKKCLNITVINYGNSQVFLNDGIVLEPGKEKRFGNENSYFEFNFQVKVTKTTGVGYGNDTNISFQSQVEIN